jgi:hypothetical protein
MELEDFAFFIYAPILLIPLVAVYCALRILKWQSKGSLFLDAWFIWLAWFVSSIIGLFGTSYISARPLIFPYLATYRQIFLSVIPIFTANLVAISFVAWLLNRRLEKEGINLFDETRKPIPWPASILEIALVTTVAAITGLIISVAAAGGIAAVYNHYNPPSP